MPSITSSSDGTKLAVIRAINNVSDASGIYTSHDSGATWTLSSAPTSTNGSSAWQYVASSADETKLVATMSNGGIYKSIDSGATWNLTSAPEAYWVSINSDYSGNVLIAVSDKGYSYSSVDGGATWTKKTGMCRTSIAFSADGTKLAAAGPYVTDSQTKNPCVYTSLNNGATWILRTLPKGYYTSIASDSTGQKLIVAQSSSGFATALGNIYTSVNGGATWTLADAPAGYWNRVTSSADGTKLAAEQSGKDTYIWTGIRINSSNKTNEDTVVSVNPPIAAATPTSSSVTQKNIISTLQIKSEDKSPDTSNTKTISQDSSDVVSTAPVTSSSDVSVTADQTPAPTQTTQITFWGRVGNFFAKFKFW